MHHLAVVNALFLITGCKEFAKLTQSFTLTMGSFKHLFGTCFMLFS